MMIARLASRAFSPGLVLIALGVALIVTGVVLDHYDMRRAEWYIGETGIALLGIGCLLALISVVAVLIIDRNRPEPEDAAGRDLDG